MGHFGTPKACWHLMVYHLMWKIGEKWSKHGLILKAAKKFLNVKIGWPTQLLNNIVIKANCIFLEFNNSSHTCLDGWPKKNHWVVPPYIWTHLVKQKRIKSLRREIVLSCITTISACFFPLFLLPMMNCSSSVLRTQFRPTLF